MTRPTGYGALANGVQYARSSVYPKSTQSTASEIDCKCRAHRLHKVFRFGWENPSANRKDCAKALKLSYNNVLEAFHQLRKRNLAILCPECFQPALQGGVCHNCGFEPSAPIVPIEVSTSNHYSTNNLHPGNELGSEVDYASLCFANHWLIVKRKIDRGIEDPLLRAVKSRVENELKRTYPTEMVTDEAGRLAIKEVFDFHLRYPELASSKNVRRQLANNVMNRLRLLHPQLRTISGLVVEATT